MKKLIASTLALTTLATPLISSAYFADTAQEPNVHYVQNEDRSEPFKEKKCNSKKTEKIFADIAAGILALTGATAAILKLCENHQLPAKFPFLFTKKTQETKENIENEKTSETATEFETAKYENIESLTVEPAFTKNSTTVETAVDSNITKNKITDPATAELNITKNETKNETTDIETVKTKIIQSLAKNNIANANDTNRLSPTTNTTRNVWNSAKDSSPIVLTIAKYAAGGLAAVAVSTLLFLAGHRAQRAFRSFWNKRTETASEAARAATATTLRLAADEVKARLAAEAAAKAAAEEARVAEIAASASEIIPQVTIEAVEKAIAIIEAENDPDNNEENVAPLVRIVRNLINS